MTTLTVGIALLVYCSVLLIIAQLGERNARTKRDSWARHPAIYTLALGVYCTSWTFYGLVGSAASDLYSFLPILLGPILLFTLGFPILQRIATLTKNNRLNSVADFLAHRYGRRHGIAATSTLILLVATVPYIALQLKAVVDSFLFIINDPTITGFSVSLLLFAIVVVFVLLFASKQMDMTRYQGGLMSVIAAESLMKLLALIAIAVLAVILLGDSEISPWTVIEHQATNTSPLRFTVETFVAAVTIFCLPRMFRVTFVELPKITHLKKSRLGFTTYLAVIITCVALIAIAGQTILDQQTSGDLFAIALPMAADFETLGLLTFIGGFSAATAMIFVATTTLSQMLSNDVVLPLLIRRNKRKSRQLHHKFSRTVMVSRRVTMILVLAAAFAYQLFLAANVALTSIGLVAFALVSQLAPAILLGIYWPKANARGVYRGLITGCGLWFYMMILPLLFNAGLITGQWFSAGPFGITWLAPTELLSFLSADSFTRTVIGSLLFNTLVIIWSSQKNRTSLSDRLQSQAVFSYPGNARPRGSNAYNNSIEIADIEELLRQFLGERQALEIVEQHVKHEKVAPTELIDAAEEMLSNLVGSASSKALIQGLARGSGLAIEDVVQIFEGTTRALRFNQDLISASFEHISSGISVVNDKLEIVAWNRRYEQMFNYPDGMLTMGQRVEELFRFNAQRGMLGGGDTDELVHKRLEHLKSGTAYRVVRQHKNIVIEIRGTPLPEGGYVTTYEDITEFITAQKALEKANTTLESRIRDRTKELEDVNEELVKQIDHGVEVERELIKAKAQAEQANREKTKLLALASHDILQPLNAASLYAGVISETNQVADAEIVHKLQSSITSAESIISSLLEISKLDSGRLTPRNVAVDVNDIFERLCDAYSVQANDAVSVTFVPTKLHVQTDPKYLARILQNFVSNAVKYTDQGKVLMGCRRRGYYVELQVWDTGHGISEENQKRIFEDFYRVKKHSSRTGIGLGLSVAQRFSELLELPIDVKSTLGKGSCFSVRVPVATGLKPKLNHIEHSPTGLEGLSVTYVDDDRENLNATKLLLTQWGCEVTTCATIEEALALIPGKGPNVLLMDFQLDKKDFDGVELAEHLTKIWTDEQAVCIVSAEPDDALADRISNNGYSFVRKPVKPAKLRAVFNRFQTQRLHRQDRNGPV